MADKIIKSKFLRSALKCNLIEPNNLSKQLKENVNEVQRKALIQMTQQIGTVNGRL